MGQFTPLTAADGFTVSAYVARPEGERLNRLRIGSTASRLFRREPGFHCRGGD